MSMKRLLRRRQRHGRAALTSATPAHEAFPWDGQRLLTSLPEPSVTHRAICNYVVLHYFLQVQATGKVFSSKCAASLIVKH